MNDTEMKIALSKLLEQFGSDEYDIWIERTDYNREVIFIEAKYEDKRIRLNTPEEANNFKGF